MILRPLERRVTREKKAQAVLKQRNNLKVVPDLAKSREKGRNQFLMVNKIKELGGGVNASSRGGGEAGPRFIDFRSGFIYKKNCLRRCRLMTQHCRNDLAFGVEWVALAKRTHIRPRRARHRNYALSNGCLIFENIFHGNTHERILTDFSEMVSFMMSIYFNFQGNFSAAIFYYHCQRFWGSRNWSQFPKVQRKIRIFPKVPGKKSGVRTDLVPRIVKFDFKKIIKFYQTIVQTNEKPRNSEKIPGEVPKVGIILENGSTAKFSALWKIEKIVNVPRDDAKNLGTLTLSCWDLSWSTLL